MMKMFKDGQNNIVYAAPRNSNKHATWRWLHCREIIVSEVTGRRILTLDNGEVHGVKNGDQQSRPTEGTTAGT
jgi:hypothetical protein